MQIAGENTAWR